MGKSIGILSLKGGVGKTSVVVALGDALSDFGKKVLLIDGDLSAPNLGLHLNIIDPEITLHEVLSREKNLRDSIHKLERFDVIPASIFSKKEISPLNLKNKVKTLKRKYDVILIDSPPSLSEEALATTLASDEILFVTTPDYPTMSATIKAMKQAKQRGAKINGLILNKVYNKKFELDIDDIEKTLGVPVMAVIPHDVNVLKALSHFTPSTSFNPGSKGSIEFKKLAAVLIGEKYKPKGFRNIFRITPSRSDINREIFYKRIFE